MKRFIVTEDQLKEFIKKKKAEKVFYQIVEDLYKCKKFLNENNVSQINTNLMIIENYKRKKLITPQILEMLIKHKIVGENYEII